VAQVSSQGLTYAHLHRNQPELAATALNDSPMGLAAWIIEKFRSLRGHK
jgi:hypothetical protein